MSELLEMRGITIQFPGVKALDGVDFTLRAGEIHSLLGENGAGKSTLIKVLAGVYPPDPGAEIVIEGERVEQLTPTESMRRGIMVGRFSMGSKFCDKNTKKNS